MKRVITILFGLAVTASFAADPVRPSRGVVVSPAESGTELESIESVQDSRVLPESETVRPTRGYETNSQVARSATSRNETGSAQARSRTEPAESVVRMATTRTKNVGLRPSVAEVGGRAVIGRTNVMTGSNIDEEVSKKLTRRTRVATNPFSGGATDTNAVSTTTTAPSSSDELASCSSAYFDCLNQFCNVLDANQQQCSCSSRLGQYKKVEDSLTKANEELNNVAQQIRYVGLSADEVRSILKETEAETVLSSTDDNTQSRDMLEEIEKIIKSPDSADFGSSSSSSMAEFELDFSSSGEIDMDSMFGGNNASFANMRGQDLYNAAKKKCSAILTRCAPKKADQSIISGQYDIEIDKACVQYEAGLQKASNGVRTNIRSATQMLQKARLAVLSSQNTFDARGCVNALDACMKDDMVCGGNYYKCLDPTKTAIDENGKVIPGGDLVKITNFLSSYNNAEISDSFLDGSTADKCVGTSSTNGQCITYYLKSRIGSMDSSGKVLSGFCRPVLDKCRRYSYNDSQYIANNTVIKSYMQRTLPQIKAAQNSIISEYASSCIHDVSDCYNSQITQVNSYSGGLSLSPSTVKPVLMGACRNVALSCAYSVFSSAADRTTGGACNTADNCINSLSNMFYQSMLCPINSTWTDTVGTPATNNKYSAGSDYVNSNCKCNNTYYVYNGTCSATPTCPTNSAWYNSTTVQANGTDGGITIAYCKCTAGFKVYNGTCVQ